MLLSCLPELSSLAFSSCLTTDCTSWSSPDPEAEDESCADLTRATCGMAPLPDISPARISKTSSWSG